MADQRTADLPEGTDKVIEGANLGSITTDPTGRDQEGDTITIDDTTGSDKVAAPKGSVDRSLTAAGGSDRGLAERLRSGREQLGGQAGGKGRGVRRPSLQRTSRGLPHVPQMWGDD